MTAVFSQPFHGEEQGDGARQGPRRRLPCLFAAKSTAQQHRVARSLRSPEAQRRTHGTSNVKEMT
jgi:hypothetical protein